MGLIPWPPSVKNAGAALEFVFDAWSAIPPDGPPDPADIALLAAFITWREAKQASKTVWDKAGEHALANLTHDIVPRVIGGNVQAHCNSCGFDTESMRP